MTTNLFTDPPRWLRLADGRMVATHERIISAAVWIAREDELHPEGRMTPGAVTIHIDAEEPLDAAGAQRLAADLLEAAELLAATVAATVETG